MKKWVAIAILSFTLLALLAGNTAARGASVNPTRVEVGVWLVNVEKVDLSANSYRLDFYLWFRFNPSEISIDEIRNFEFINGAPTKYEVKTDGAAGYLEYRVRGDFINSFDFSNYQFETHELTVEIEHKTLDNSQLIFEGAVDSNIDPDASVSGWTLEGFRTKTTGHSYGEDIYSRFIFSVDLNRPALSSFIKSVLPVAIITTISLLAFFMSPQNFAQRITLGVTTLMSATTFHLSLISGIPPTGYLTFADRMMLSIYAIFLYNLATSVYIMRLVDCKKSDEAIKVNMKAKRFLPVLITILVIIQIILR
ncbi:MAG: hypothetical protein NWE94_02860 [Candidatus Bathyarchaeota archaeon]|nr:hypothetical protein [Candidatus Bathyarchaeota archaeon]